MKAKKGIAWLLSLLMVFSLMLGVPTTRVYADVTTQVAFVVRTSNGASGEVEYCFNVEGYNVFTKMDTTQADIRIPVPDGATEITVRATPSDGYKVNQNNSGIWLEGNNVITDGNKADYYSALTSEDGYTYSLTSSEPQFVIEFDNTDGTNNGNPNPGVGAQIGFVTQNDAILAVEGAKITYTDSENLLGTIQTYIDDSQEAFTNYETHENNDKTEVRISIPEDTETVTIILIPEDDKKAMLWVGGDTPEEAVSDPVVNEENNTYTYTVNVNILAEEGNGSLFMTIWFGEDEGMGEEDFTAVIWDGNQVENTSAHGTISVSSVVIGQTVYTYMGNGKFGYNNQESNLIEWYGYDKTDVSEEAGVRIFDAAFEGGNIEVYINFVFKPDYGYQVTGIGTNENATSLVEAGFNATDTISTFQFQVFQHNNPHFAVVFSKSNDVTDVSGAQELKAAIISNAQNVTDSGNLKLTVSDLSDKDIANVANKFTEYVEAVDSSNIMYFDLDLFQILSKGTAGSNWENQLTDLKNDLSVTLQLSDELKGTDGTFYLIREHEEANGTKTYDKIQAAYNKANGTITFATDKFSTYALVNESIDNGSDDNNSSQEKTPVLVSSIKLSKTSVKLLKGKTTTLKATVTPKAADNTKVIWKSSNSKVATVNADGKVTAKGYGTATITATAADGSGVKASCKVTVGYGITYKLNKGSNHKNNPLVYYKEKITLKSPTRKGYTFKGWYTDNKFKNKITTIKKSEKKNYTLYAKWEKVSVKKTTLSSVKNSKSKSLVLKYKKSSGAKGYEISYSTDKKFKNAVTKKTTSKANYTIKSLKKGKTYYVRVRAYKVDSTGKKVYSGYSKVVKVKIKK